MSRPAYIFALIAATMASAAHARSSPPRQPFIPVGAVADAPRGFTEMCDRDATACADGVTGPTAAAPSTFPVTVRDLRSFTPDRLLRSEATAALARRAAHTPAIATRRAGQGRALPESASLTLVRKVNSAVNRRVIQRPDTTNFGMEEFWRRSGMDEGASGDCEDIAMEKRAQLVAAGFPADRLFLATVFRSEIGLHVVLIARLDDGDHVLDSLSPHILPWQQARYSWLRMQTPGAPMEWRRLGARETRL